MQLLQNRTVNDMGEQFRIVMEVYELEDGVPVCATDLNGSPMSFAPLTVATMDTREEALAWMAELPRMTTVQPSSEGRLLTDEEYFAAFEAPVVEGRSPCWNIAIAQDAKTAAHMQAKLDYQKRNLEESRSVIDVQDRLILKLQAQVDAAKADAARSMAAYKDAYAATQLMGQMLEERSNETLLNHAIYSDDAGGVDTNHTCTLDNRGAVEIG
jgi:hypothetical protein